MFGFNKGPWQDSWSHHRSPYLRVTLIVVAVHLLFFVFAPPFHFKPYRLEAQEIMIVENVPDIEIPPPVADEPKAPVNIDPWRGDEDPDIEIPPNVFYDWRDMPLPPQPKPRAARKFFWFDKPPVVKHLVTPTYPDLARQAGIEGIVKVKVRIDKTGKVIDAVVVESDVTDTMNRAALAAARRCTFEPAMQGKEPVPVTIVIPFEFRLDKR